MKKSRIRETLNLSTNADSRTDTILGSCVIFCFIFYLFLRDCVIFLNQNLKKKFKKNNLNHATSPKLYRSYYPHWSRELLSPVCGIFFTNSSISVGVCGCISVWSVRDCLLYFSRPLQQPALWTGKSVIREKSIWQMNKKC